MRPRWGILYIPQKLILRASMTYTINIHIIPHVYILYGQITRSILKAITIQKNKKIKKLVDFQYKSIFTNVKIEHKLSL